MLKAFCAGFFSVLFPPLFLFIWVSAVRTYREERKQRLGCVRPRADVPRPGDTSPGVRDWSQPASYMEEAPRG